MIMNIVDKIYSNSHFTTILIGAIAFLVVLFIVVLYLGIKDAKKAKNPKKEEEKQKDITFEEVTPEQKEIAEDVTFEMGTITKNLEDFKKGLEEELQNETTEVKVVNEKKIDEPVKEEPKEEDNISEEEVEDNFLDLIDLKKEEPKEEKEENTPISLEEVDAQKENEKKNEPEIELPKMNEDKKEDNLNKEARKKRERMIDDYLSATQSLSLDAINEKIEEMEKDNF